MPKLKQKLASTAFKTLQSTGALSLVGQMRRRNRGLVILCYHGVSLHDEHEWRPDLYISPERFRQRLTHLRDARVSVLPLAEGIARMQSNRLPAKSVCITFDDGFVDFSQRATPLLEEFGYPATVYLTTHYAKYPLPIFNLMLDYVLWKSKQTSVLLPEYGIAAPMPVGDVDSRMAAVRKIVQWIIERDLDTAGKNQIVAAIAARFGVDYDSILQSRLLQIMNGGEAQAVAQSGLIDIQLHTHRHRTPSDRALFEKEIDDNRAAIREISGKDPVHFCYPSGQYSNTFAQWLRGCDVQSATTCVRGMAQPGSDPMLLPRVLDDSLQQEARFDAALNGVVV